MTHKQYSDGTLIAAFGYDGKDETGNQFSQNGFQSLNSIGRLSVVTNQINAGKAFSYGSMGRVQLENLFLPSVNAWNTLASAKYDLAGNLTDLWYPSGRHIQQGWDSAGRLNSSNLVDISGMSQSQSYLSSVLYSPDGSPETTTLGNGVQQLVTENNRLQTQSLMVNSPVSGVVLSHSYCYTNCSTGGTVNNGNIWGIVDNLNPALTQGFTYDALNRISTFSLGGTVAQQYAIDSFGNMTGTLGVNYVSCFDPATNRMNNGACTPTLISGTLPPSLGYDNAGNLTQDSDPNGLPRTYTYDAESRITGISMTSNPPFETYVYGADGNRVNKTNAASGNLTEYVDFNGQTIAEKDQNGVWTDYIYANGSKIAKTMSSEPVFHMWGNDCDPSVCGGQFAVMVYGPPAQNRLLQKGDTFQSMQNNSGPAGCGGMTLVFSDNSWTNFATPDQNGVITDFDRQQGWHKRIFSLDAFTGLSITKEYFINEQCGLQGAWDMRYSDISVTGTDGTVWPIYNQATSGSFGLIATSGITGLGEEITQRAASDVDISTGLADLNTTFYVADHLGSAQMEFASAGWPLSSTQFAPYGTQINPDGAANHYKFTGKERDTESGLDYFGARYYGSNMGRWMSPDWSEGPDPIPYADLSDPQSLNLYSYLTNNPLSQVDDDGHDGAAPTAVCGGGIGGVLCKIWQGLTGPGSGGTPVSNDRPLDPYAQAVFSQLGRNANAAMKPIAVGTLIAGAAVAGPFIAVESAGAGIATLGLSHSFTEAEIEIAVESAGESTGVGSTAGRDAIQSHASRPGSPFGGMQRANPGQAIRDIMENPRKVIQTTTQSGNKYVDIIGKNGRGVRLVKATGKFFGFLSK